MEIGNAFVVNKADRDGAQAFANNLTKMLHQRKTVVPVFKTVADKNQGISELLSWISNTPAEKNERKQFLYAEKAFRLIQNYRMKDVVKSELQLEIARACEAADFNLYKFVSLYYKD